MRIIEFGIESTECCNAECQYCFNNSGPRRSTYLSVEYITKIAQYAADMEPVPPIYLSGGEFLVHPNWKEIIQILSRKAIPTSVISNGILLNDEALRLFQSLHFERLQVSLDGLNERTNMLRSPRHTATIVANIEKAARHFGKKLLVKVTVSKANCDHLAEMIDFARDNGVSIAFGYMQAMGRGINNQFILDSMEIFTCHKSLLSHEQCFSDFTLPILATHMPCGLMHEDPEIGLRITPNGDVYPCHGIMEPGFRLGNIQDENLDDIISNERFSTIRTNILAWQREIVSRGCKSCYIRDMCKGGCPGVALYEMGDTLQPSTRLCTGASRIAHYSIPFFS